MPFPGCILALLQRVWCSPVVIQALICWFRGRQTLAPLFGCWDGPFFKPFIENPLLWPILCSLILPMDPKIIELVFDHFLWKFCYWAICLTCWYLIGVTVEHQSKARQKKSHSSIWFLPLWLVALLFPCCHYFSLVSSCSAKSPYVRECPLSMVPVYQGAPHSLFCS